MSPLIKDEIKNDLYNNGKTIGESNKFMFPKNYEEI